MRLSLALVFFFPLLFLLLLLFFPFFANALYQDVLIAMGIVDGNEGDASGLGVECSGVVTRLGPDVVDLHVGDRVAVLATSSYSTVLKTPADMCVRIPDGLGFEEAATMPSVFGTVIYGLLHLANLEAGQVSALPFFPTICEICEQERC